ncbi:MAG TPA: hypothetical protein VIU11_18820 [Nakamurella sp.]
MSANDPRLTFFLDDQDNRPLTIARGQDGLPASDRIRAVVQLWQQGGPTAERIDELAAELRRARLTRDSPTTNVQRTKLSLDLGTSRLRALAQARVDDGIPAAERVRAALQIWQRDPGFRAEVDKLAAELREHRWSRTVSGPTTADPPRSDREVADTT